MEDPRELFLAAEEKADRLVSQLASLKQKMEEHAAAEESLSKARDGLLSAIESLGEIGVQVKDVVSALGKVGTPEILSSIQSALESGTEAISGVGTSVEGKIAHINDELNAQKRLIWLLIGGQIVVVIGVLLSLVMLFVSNGAS